MSSHQYLRSWVLKKTLWIKGIVRQLASGNAHDVMGLEKSPPLN